MKKKLLISLFAVFVLVLAAGAITYAVGPMKNMRPSDYNIGISYEQEMKSDKPAVVLFYANWCTFCKKFMPQYKLLSEVYGKDYNFVMVDIDNPQYQGIIKDYAITGFPTLFIVDPAVDNRICLSNGLYSNLFALRTELDRFLRIRKMINIPQKSK
jgi:thiol-disulfide isomerase/thioredoxin